MATPHEPPGPRSGLTDAQRWTLGGIAALVVLVLAVVFVLAAGDDEDDAATIGTTAAETTTTATTTEPTTTVGGETTTTGPFPSDVDQFAVAFPSPADSRRFDAPAAAARAFATDVLGFTEFVMGGPIETGEDTAMVGVQEREDGPETIVYVQRMADETWYAVGAGTEDITVDAPAPGTSLASPFETSGQALAFEGTVEVVVVSQREAAPLGQGVVTGSGTPPPGPYRGKIEFRPPPEPVGGVVVYRIRSGDDGRVIRAAAVRVRLTPLTS